jgi:putative DNA primase/helicase
MAYKADLIAFLQTAAGWSVSGDTSEQSIFILYGTGANGKSTFLNVIQNIFGRLRPVHLGRNVYETEQRHGYQ